MPRTSVAPPLPRRGRLAASDCLSATCALWPRRTDACHAAAVATEQDACDVASVLPPTLLGNRPTSSSAHVKLRASRPQLFGVRQRPRSQP